MLFTKTHFKYEATHRLKVNGSRKIYGDNIIQKKVERAMFILLRANFKARKVNSVK